MPPATGPVRIRPDVPDDLFRFCLACLIGRSGRSRADIATAWQHLRDAPKQRSVDRGPQRARARESVLSKVISGKESLSDADVKALQAVLNAGRNERQMPAPERSLSAFRARLFPITAVSVDGVSIGAEWFSDLASMPARNRSELQVQAAALCEVLESVGPEGAGAAFAEIDRGGQAATRIIQQLLEATTTPPARGTVVMSLLARAAIAPQASRAITDFVRTSPVGFRAVRVLTVLLQRHATVAATLTRNRIDALVGRHDGTRIEQLTAEIEHTLEHLFKVPPPVNDGLHPARSLHVEALGVVAPDWHSAWWWVDARLEERVVDERRPMRERAYALLILARRTDLRNVKERNRIVRLIAGLRDTDPANGDGRYPAHLLNTILEQADADIRADPDGEGPVRFELRFEGLPACGPSDAAGDQSPSVEVSSLTALGPWGDDATSDPQPRGTAQLATETIKTCFDEFVAADKPLPIDQQDGGVRLARRVPEEVRDATRLLIETSVLSCDGVQRRVACDALRTGGLDAAASEILCKLLDAPQEDDWLVKTACTSIGLLGAPSRDTIERLVKVVEESDHRPDEVRSSAIHALADLLGSPPSRRAIVEDSTPPDDDEVERGLDRWAPGVDTNLGRAVAAAVRLLQEIAQDPNEADEVVRAAVFALICARQLHRNQADLISTLTNVEEGAFASSAYPDNDPLVHDLAVWGLDRIHADIIDDPLRATRTTTLVQQVTVVDELLAALDRKPELWQECFAALVDSQIRQLSNNPAELALLSHATMAGTDAGAWFRRQVAGHYSSAVVGLTPIYRKILAAGRREPRTSIDDIVRTLAALNDGFIVRSVVDGRSRPTMDLSDRYPFLAPGDDTGHARYLQPDAYLASALAVLDALTKPIDPGP